MTGIPDLDFFLYVKIPNIGCHCHAHHLKDGKIEKGDSCPSKFEQQCLPLACLCYLQKAQVAYQKAH